MRTLAPKRFRAVALAGLLLAATSATGQPPFGGTIFLDPDIITSADPSEFLGLTRAGRGLRTMFDRRANAFLQVDAFLFDAAFADGRSVEVQVNGEYGNAAAAEAEALRFLPAIGRLPRVLRRDVDTVWIHRGDEPFGGGNRNLLIHTGAIAEGYLRDGILEETFVHEAVHTSLDADHADSPGWRGAQDDDPDFISTYARDFPRREDLAESVLPWLAVRHAADRIDAGLRATIEATIPNRLAYLDTQDFDLRPMLTGQPPAAQFWIVGVGTFDGSTLAVDEAVSTAGGAFGSAFDPGAIENRAWGAFELILTGCAEGSLTWTPGETALAEGFESGTYPVERIAPNGVQRDCEARGFASGFDPTWAAGAWFGGPARSGEGVLVDVLEGGRAFAAWFTYPPAAD